VSLYTELELLFLVLLRLRRAGVRKMVAGGRIIHAPIGIGVIDAGVTLLQLGLTRVSAVFGALERNSLLNAARLAAGLSTLSLLLGLSGILPPLMFSRVTVEPRRRSATRFGHPLPGPLPGLDLARPSYTEKASHSGLFDLERRSGLSDSVRIGKNIGGKGTARWSLTALLMGYRMLIGKITTSLFAFAGRAYLCNTPPKQ
jgi:hypothetical protein